MIDINLDDYTFNIIYDINDINKNTIYISCNNSIVVDVILYEYDISDNLYILYRTVTEFNNNTFFYTTNKNFFDIKRMKVEIYYQNHLIKDSILNFTNIKFDENDIDNIFNNYINKKRTDKQVSIFILKELGLGDFMCATPLIRKLYNIYNKKIDIYGYKKYYEFIKNNPYINNFYISNDFNLNEIESKNENFTIFSEVGAPYIFSDIKQLVSKTAGITLKEEELELDYTPDEYIKIDELPENYVLINPRIDCIDRRFRKNEEWQLLVDLLNERNISVVAIGVGPSDHHINLNIKNGLNLIYDERQNSLSQTWHIINRSKAFVTFDTGMYIFAGTTNTNILLNGWNSDPWFHQSYRNGSKEYKFSTVRGYCPFYCSNNPMKSAIELGSIRNLHKTNICALNINYNCIPDPNMIINKLIELKWI